jgi:broad specificity phosphatase PhoE
MIIFIRHAPSESNKLRDQGLDGSQLRDPGLSTEGKVVVEAYGPTLRKRLEAEGVNLDTAVYASSPLKRAKQTLAALFPGKHGIILSLFGENGRIPENTPAGETYQKPDIDRILDHLAALTVLHNNKDIIVVGHGSFLTSTVWPTFSKKPHEKFKNLDAFIVKDTKVKDLPIRMVLRNRKTRTKRSKNRKTRKMRRRTNQRGGFPLAMYQSGAQFSGTSPTMTGRDLVTSTDVMVRSGLGRF